VPDGILGVFYTMTILYENEFQNPQIFPTDHQSFSRGIYFTGKLEFEDGLGSGVFVSRYSYRMIVRTALGCLIVQADQITKHTYSHMAIQASLLLLVVNLLT
jgi:hypothetical protein